MKFGEKISDFWMWFVTRSLELSGADRSPALLEELDRRLHGLNQGLSWELGPRGEDGCQLVISPNLDVDLRDVARKVVALAPQLPGWRFYPSRPAKNWDYVFYLDTSSGKRLRIDATRWTFALLKYQDGEHELLLCRNSVSPVLDEDDRWHAATVLLESILGEETLMDIHCRYELLDVLEPRFAAAARSVGEIHSAFAS